MPKLLMEEEVAPGRMLWALAILSPEDPRGMYLAGASLAKKKSVAQADLDLLCAGVPGKRAVIQVAYDELRSIWIDAPVVAGGG